MKTISDNSNKRIVKNSALLYVRMIFLMLINLYAARIILHSLGVENYGIYNAVGGFISMFSMLSSSLTTAIGRFLTYTLGENDDVKLNKVFSASVIIQLILCGLLLIVAETVGVWFLNYKMTIPCGREFAANCVFQFSLVTFVINLMSVPYNSMLIAHEKMGAFAYIGIFEGIATLCIAFLIKVSPIDVLIFYSVLMCSVALLTRMIYGFYCKANFVESKVRWNFDKDLIKKMFSFAGWNFIGTTSGVLRTQGINMLYNVFYGPVVNAAYGLSMQVFNAVNKFSSNFYTAVQPQITKSYAQSDKERSFYLVCTGSRLAFYLLMLIICPLLWNTNYLLFLWLSDVPPYTESFVRIVLLFCLIESFSQPLIYLMLANGRIRNYQLIVGGLYLLNFPVAWLLLCLGMSPEYVQSTMIVFSFIGLFLRLIMLKSMIDFPMFRFLRETICRVLFVVMFVSAIVYIYSCLNEGTGLMNFILSTLIIEVAILLVIYLCGLNSKEKTFIKSKIRFQHASNRA